MQKSCVFFMVGSKEIFQEITKKIYNKNNHKKDKGYYKYWLANEEKTLINEVKSKIIQNLRSWRENKNKKEICENNCIHLITL